jgi:predicted amidophosphoribosyltransferase
MAREHPENCQCPDCQHWYNIASKSTGICPHCNKPFDDHGKGSNGTCKAELKGSK